ATPLMGTNCFQPRMDANERWARVLKTGAYLRAPGSNSFGGGAEDPIHIRVHSRSFAVQRLFINFSTIRDGTVSCSRNMRIADQARQAPKPPATPSAPARTSCFPAAQRPRLRLVQSRLIVKPATARNQVSVTVPAAESPVLAA